MKTLILNGSPRKDGDTVFLINKLLSRLQGEYKIIDCYTADIAPCIDCRCCREKLSCPIRDEMQEIYAYLESGTREICLRADCDAETLRRASAGYLHAVRRDPVFC